MATAKRIGPADDVETVTLSLTENEAQAIRYIFGNHTSGSWTEAAKVYHALGSAQVQDLTSTALREKMGSNAKILP